MWTCRPATPDDAGFMARLHAANLRRAWGLPEGLADPALDSLIAQQHQWRETAYAAAHGRAGCQLIVRTSDGQPLGRCWVAAGETLHLVDLAVLPGEQGQGVGRWALGELQAQAQARGLDLTLEADPQQAAHALYLRCGFVPDGPTQPAEAAGTDQRLRWHCPARAAHDLTGEPT